MDERFQDKIDDYLLNRMDADEREALLREVEQDAEKKAQLEFTQCVKAAIRSREEKLGALKEFRQRFEYESMAPAAMYDGCVHYSISSGERGEIPMPIKPVRSVKRKWLWISCAAAVLVAGFFVVRSMLVREPSPARDDAPLENVRGGDEWGSPTPADSTESDTIRNDAREEKLPDE